MREWMQRNFNKLFGAVHFGAKVGFRARADVAVHAGHMGMRGDFVGGVLRMHHVAGLAAELGRVHLGRAAIRADGYNQQVDGGGDLHNVQAAAKNAASVRETTTANTSWRRSIVFIA
jgi:hypothetical protein